MTERKVATPDRPAMAAATAAVPTVRVLTDIVMAIFLH